MRYNSGSTVVAATVNLDALLSHRKIMEWTNDDALELIEQYRCHTELWNRADPKYKDKLCRFRAWSEIAESFGCSKAEVERKMNVLLTQYRREKHKMLVKLYQGIQPNPSKWYAFKRFDFMEAGGGSGSSGGSTGGGSSGGGGDGGIGTNGHQHHHHNSAATAAALNGLAAAAAAVSGYDAAASVAAAASSSGSGTTTHHRRIKSKEMKYFGAMGINIPMLIANSQTLDSWNTVGQYSPPIGERSQLRVPLPISFSASQNDLNAANATRNLFIGGGGGGGGSSNSDFNSSPQKAMDTSDIDDSKDDGKLERRTPNSSSTHDATETGSVAIDGSMVEGAGGGGGGGGGSGAHGDSGSSPIPNTNTHEAHKNHLPTQHPPPLPLTSAQPLTAALRAHEQDELDIKQELVDYFHAPHPPAPPDSHRSYSSTEDNRHGGNVDIDFAQDLRISAAAAAAAKGLDFSHFVLPPRNMRRSTTDSIEEKYTVPLNMRKFSSSNATATSAGQMLMNSLLSNESMSDADATSQGRIKSASQDAASAAAALYAESLNRDDCDFIGSNVSLKLRAMDRTQRIIAEKLISEVLYYGQFNELERSARIQPK